MYYMGFSYSEGYSIPIWQRIWFIERINKEIKESQGQNRSVESNTADNRSLMGRSRGEVPAKLRRFT